MYVADLIMFSLWIGLSAFDNFAPAAQSVTEALPLGSLHKGLLGEACNFSTGINLCYDTG